MELSWLMGATRLTYPTANHRHIMASTLLYLFLYHINTIRSSMMDRSALETHYMPTSLVYNRSTLAVTSAIILIMIGNSISLNYHLHILESEVNEVPLDA